MNDAWSYSVDVVFDTTQPPSHPAVTAATPDAGSSSNPVSTDPTVTFSEPVVPGTLSFTLKDPNGNSVSGTTTLGSNDTVATFSPADSLAAGTTYTVTVSGAQDGSGQTMLAPYTYTFTTSKAFDAGGRCPCAIWPDITPSGVSDVSDQSPGVELGVRFTAAQDGSITGIRFYKVPDTTGTHAGSLWTASGTLLATGTFTNESTEGWEELGFSSPVPMTAGTTYVASYHKCVALRGHGRRADVGRLERAADGTGQRWCVRVRLVQHVPVEQLRRGELRYWVDVVYSGSPGGSAPTVSGSTPDSGSGGNLVSVAPRPRSPRRCSPARCRSRSRTPRAPRCPAR